MKTLAPLTDTGLAQFEFAGIQFPKYVWTLPPRSLQKRLEQFRNRICGPYYHAPTPNQRNGIGFYLASDGMPGLRWKWADEVTLLNHKGWYCDEFQSETIRGVVFRLPRSRGFLAGYSMGEGMTSSLDYDIYDTAEDAARVADFLARNAAQREREYQEEERAKERESEERELSEAAEEMDLA